MAKALNHEELYELQKKNKKIHEGFQIDDGIYVGTTTDGDSHHIVKENEITPEILHEAISRKYEDFLRYRDESSSAAWEIGQMLELQKKLGYLETECDEL